MPLFGNDGLFGQFIEGIIEGVAGPQRNSYPDRASYLKARLEYAKKECDRIEKNMKNSTQNGTANPNDLDKIAKLSKEISDIRNESGLW